MLLLRCCASTFTGAANRMSATNSTRRVAFQGESGAFSEEAAIYLLGEEIETVSRPTFEALFSSVKDGNADYALAPIENSLAGSVHKSYDLLLESHLHVVREVILPIAHNLIGTPRAAIEQITRVDSHPVALAQCEHFFHARPQIHRVASLDTAGSVREIILAGDPSRAAIAGKRAAKIYGGNVLLEHIEDHRENYTRFLLLGASPEPSERADKLSLVVHLEHKPGALQQALEVFAKRSISLLKIESRPIPGQPWEYRFYLDLQASLNDPEAARALEELRACATEVRILGCYPSHQALK